jgi:hypothetical protein
LLSPFNRFTTTPPTIVRDGAVLGHLTVNPLIPQAIDTNSFLAWFRAT